MSNFEFLKTIDTDLYKLISDAEKLYRDEYFEQSIIQTRRFAENVCKSLLGDKLIPDSTFDEALATLQDIYTKNIRQRELISDLYFLKAQGNASAHGKQVKQDGNIALDCIKRAFEVGINFAVFNGASSNIEKLEFSEETLVMGEKKTKSKLKKKKVKKKKKKKKKKKLQKRIIKFIKRKKNKQNNMFILVLSRTKNPQKR